MPRSHATGGRQARKPAASQTTIDDARRQPTKQYWPIRRASNNNNNNNNNNKPLFSINASRLRFSNLTQYARSTHIQFPSPQGNHSRDFTNFLSFYAPGNEVPVGLKNNNNNNNTDGELGETAAKLLGNQTKLSQLHLLSTTFLAENSVLQPVITLYTRHRTHLHRHPTLRM